MEFLHPPPHPYNTIITNVLPPPPPPLYNTPEFATMSVLILKVLLKQWFSTGVPRHTGVPWTSAKCAAAHWLRPDWEPLYDALCPLYVPYKTENDYTLFLWKTSSCSETLNDEHLNEGRNENIPSSTDKLVSLQHKINIWKSRIAANGNFESIHLRCFRLFQRM